MIICVPTCTQQKTELILRLTIVNQVRADQIEIKYDMSVDLPKGEMAMNY